MSGRYALVVSNDVYDDPVLRGLKTLAPGADELAQALRVTADFDVQYQPNASVEILRRSIADLLIGRRRGDLVLLYFHVCCLHDNRGQLYFAATDTAIGGLDETAMSAEFLRQCIDRTSAVRIVLLLDCSYGLASGRRARVDSREYLGEQLQIAAPVSVFASSLIDYSHESDGPSPAGHESGVTSAVVEAVKDGRSEFDSVNGLDAFYDHVYRRVRQLHSNQIVFKLYAGRAVDAGHVQQLGYVEPRPISAESASEHVPGATSYLGEAAVLRAMLRVLAGPDRARAAEARQFLEQLRDHGDPGLADIAARALTIAAEAPAARTKPSQAKPTPYPEAPVPGKPRRNEDADAPVPSPAQPADAPVPEPPRPAQPPSPVAPRTPRRSMRGYLRDLAEGAFTRGRPRGPGSPQPSLQPLRRTPHMDVRGGEPVRPGVGFDVAVYCDVEAARAGESVTPVEILAPPSVVEFPLQVWLAGSAHFSVSEPVATLIVSRDRPSSKRVIFRVAVVHAAPAGPGQLSAVFSYAGRPCGQVTRTVAVTGGGDEETDSGPARPGPARVVIHEGTQRPDLVVEIKAVSGNEREFACRFVTRLVEGHDRPAPTSWHLASRAPDLVASYMQDFVAPGLSDAERVSKLSGAGMALWQAAPEAFTSLFWRLIDAGCPVCSILVVSDEWSFPWELMVPHRGRGASREVRRPLGVEFQVGRWVTGDMTSPAQRIALDTSLVLAPDYPWPHTLLHSPAEARYVCEHFDGQLVKPGCYDALEQTFARSPVPLVHFVCHGATSTTQSQALMLEFDGQLLSHQLAAMPALSAAIAARQPLVFLNACEVGRGQPALAGVGGFASAFIELGAQCVLAPLWSVDDAIAHRVATEFYDQVLAKPSLPFARILQGIRERAYGKGGADTYAAYCLYGDPLAHAA